MRLSLKHTKWWKVLLIITGSMIVFIIVVCFLVDLFVQHRKSDAVLLRHFREKNIPAAIRYYTIDNRSLRYVSVGYDSLPTLLFLHGSPGSLSFYEAQFTNAEFLKTFRMIAPDRPGYGYSGFGIPEPSVQQQAKMIFPIIHSLNQVRRPLIIVAYSYGAAVACRLLMDHPGIADGLILLAPALEPGKEKYFWFTPLIEKPFIRWMVPRLFKSANTEKLHHEKELTKMLPYWGRIMVPVMYVQGEKDQWADTSNAGFVRTQLTHVPWLHIEWLKQRDHFFAYTEKEIINRAIFTFYHRIS